VKFLVRLFSFVLFGFFIVSCSRSNPASPSPPSVPGPSPQPVPGTTVQSVPLPGTNELLLIWITALSPNKNGQLVIGQQAYVSYTCGGPAGYSAFITSEFLIEGVAEKGPWGSGGGSIVIDVRCDTRGGPTPLLVNSTTPNVTAVRWYVWVEKAPNWPLNRDIRGIPPDAILTESLGWKGVK